MFQVMNADEFTGVVASLIVVDEVKIRPATCEVMGQRMHFQAVLSTQGLSRIGYIFRNRSLLIHQPG